MDNPHRNSEIVYNVGLSEQELTELIRLIDDEDDLDEDFLMGVRRKLVHKQKQLRAKKRRA